ncbi:hypothetical protein BS50DRAFT_261816 [Corynespora cassiicola Philippines]|uniref:Uncharacterized protein n=1 Tax=Corynespora cassiicola Philippines TaxID=1448308 RepID=A0A2T2N1N2_CORCC|nr:hypothetical protein BS50DRAFT_261816 [Corynespora cassiicola Philippines]
MHSFSNASIGHCPQRKSHREGGFQMMAPFSPVRSPAQHNLPRISMLAAADSSQKERISSRPFQLPEKPSKRDTLSFSSPARHQTQL